MPKAQVTHMGPGGMAPALGALWQAHGGIELGTERHGAGETQANRSTQFDQPNLQPSLRYKWLVLSGQA